MVKINSDGIFENPVGKQPPAVDAANPVASVSDIRGISVRNTINPPAHANQTSASGSETGLITGIPSKLPFD